MGKVKAAPNEPETQVRAVAKYIRTSPRKMRLVADLIRGKSAQEAWNILEFTPKRATGPMKKVLESAIANAQNNNEIAPETLKVWRVLVDEGPTLKRFRPRARGRASAIKKRTCHITIIVATEGEA
ncbi:MAG: 50S ribosomal protein L22 [Vulcanimicrobiota bacterium]